MVVYEGKAVFEGIAIGKLYVYTKQEQTVKRVKVDDCEAEKKRYEKARETAMEQLQGLYDKALKEVGESGAEIFEAHQFLVEDGDYIDSVENIIDTEGVNAEYAVATTGDNFFKMLQLPSYMFAMPWKFRQRSLPVPLLDFGSVLKRFVPVNPFSGIGRKTPDRNQSDVFWSFLIYKTSVFLRMVIQHTFGPSANHGTFVFQITPYLHWVRTIDKACSPEIFIFHFKRKVCSYSIIFYFK